MKIKKSYIKPSVELTEVLENKVICVSNLDMGGTIDHLDSPEPHEYLWLYYWME